MHNNQLNAHSAARAPSPVLSRRRFFFLSGAGLAASAITAGCGYFPPEEGAAYAPWRWPDPDDSPELRAVGAAVLAANPHNTQPWRFEVQDRRIDLFADFAQSLGPLDPYRREMHIGLGCAVENLRIAAEAEAGLTVTDLLPAGDDTHIATAQLSGDPGTPSPLLQRINKRRTNRGPYVDREVPAGLGPDLDDLIEDVEIELTVLRTASDRQDFRQAVIDATRAIIDDTEMNEASHSWYRHTEEEIEAHRDGLTLDTTGIGAGTRFFGKIGSRPDADKAAKYWLKNTIEYQTTAGAFCILTASARHSALFEVICGRTFQRIHLFADSVGLGVQPLNQMPERSDREEQLGLAPEFTERLSTFIPSGRVPLMVFRIGYPLETAFTACRKPVEWVTEVR